MYDFEANKRNNLIFYGIPNDPNESSESLVVKMQVGIRGSYSYIANQLYWGFPNMTKP